MPYPHPIRLRGPWDYRVLESADPALAGKAGRVSLPTDWRNELGIGFQGRVRYSRKFHRPATLDAHERLWMVVGGADARGQVFLNGQRLGEVAGYAVTAEFEITGSLESYQELALDVEVPQLGSYATAAMRPGREHDAGGPIGEVQLEVRSQHFVRGLAVEASQRGGTAWLNVSGEVAGPIEDSALALVISSRGRELHYAEIAASDFDFSIEAPELPRWPAEDPRLESIDVRLIAGAAAVWQTSRPTAARPPLSENHATSLAPELIVSNSIREEAWYTSMDQRRTAIVQAMPARWAAVVCPRLAHHPTIAAWTAVPGEVSELPRLTCGRPWIAREALVTLVNQPPLD